MSTIPPTSAAGIGVAVALKKQEESAEQGTRGFKRRPVEEGKKGTDITYLTTRRSRNSPPIGRSPA